MGPSWLNTQSGTIVDTVPVISQVAVGHWASHVEKLLVSETKPVVVSIKERVVEEDLLEPAKVPTPSFRSVLNQCSEY